MEILFVYRSVLLADGQRYRPQDAQPRVDGSSQHLSRLDNDRVDHRVGDGCRRLADTDLPSMTMRQPRHSHATALVRAGVHPKVVQERLGHSNIGMTLDIYGSVLPTMQREAVERL